MTEIQEVDVFVKPDGTITVEVRGVSGPKCLDLTEGIEALLGNVIADRVHTQEYDVADQDQIDEDVVRIGR